MIKLLIAVALSSLCLPSFSSEYLGGNYWNNQCNQQGREGFLRCAAFTTGGLGGIQLQAAITEAKVDFCIPETATPQQTTDVYAKYLRDNPQHRHQLAVALLAVALRDAFPCKK